MIVVHHLERSRSQRIVWLLEELGVPYDIKRYKRDAKTMLAPREMRAVHRLGKSPIVEDDGTLLIESGAAVEYLCARYGKDAGLSPVPGMPDYLAYLTFLHFAEGSLMPPLVMRLVFQEMGRRSPALARPLVRAVTAPVDKLYVQPTLTRMFDFLEAELEKRPWFAGTAFTAADIMMSFPIEMAHQRDALDAARPKLKTYLDRIHARSAYKTAMEKIGEA